MKPRQILKGSTYLLTRRTTQRLFLLRPSRAVNACIRYCLALAQRRSEVDVHCAVFMSNHYHLVVTDTKGRLPEFTEELNKLIARALNCHLGRWENFWSGGDQTSQVLLESRHDILAKLVYALANPTQALLVSHGNQWPGVRLFRKGEYLAKKPPFFFRSRENGGELPDRLNLTLSPPPIGAASSDCDDIIACAVSARERELRARACSQGKSYRGAAAVKAQHIYGAPSKCSRRRGLSPHLASRDKWRRIEKLGQLVGFVAEYREKRQRYIAGDKDALFPAGTYQFAKRFGARCREN